MPGNLFSASVLFGGGGRMSPLWAICIAGLIGVAMSGPFDWMWKGEPDTFDSVMEKMNMVNPDNCRALPEYMLKLDNSTLAQVPRANRLRSSFVYSNRTKLLHLHNMALYRAFFFSYSFYRLNETYNFELQPGLMYYYMSLTADVAANEYFINGSAIFFDHNTSFPNWWRELDFNYTMSLFSPRAYRQDDTTDPQNIVREPTNNTFNVVDYGTGYGKNYTLPSYKINGPYRNYLPDHDQTKDSIRKTTYDVGIKISDRPGHFKSENFIGFSFFGPPEVSQEDSITNPDQKMPVLFTAPYYDCGRSNKWIVSASAPVLDKLHRYHKWHHIRRNQWTAVTSMDIDFLKIDINQCDLGTNNQPPNVFAGTHRCKKNTVCMPIPNFGFQRGGYECHCRQGYRYPPWVKGPYLGLDIERATEGEYRNGFDCLSVERMQVESAVDEECDADIAGRKRRDVTPVKKQFVMRVAPNHHGLTKSAKHRAAAESKRARKLRNPYYKYTPNANLLLPEEDKPSPKHHLVPKHKTPKAPPKKKKTTVVAKQHVRREGDEKKEKKRPKHKLGPRQKNDHPKRRHKRALWDSTGYQRAEQIFSRKEAVRASNCADLPDDKLWLPGDVMYGAEKQFEIYARLGVRLANFLSNFLQNVFAKEDYGTLKGDKLLNDQLLFGEVISLVMGDLTHYVQGAGIFFDSDKFINASGKVSSLFGPYAFRNGTQGKKYFALDYAGEKESYETEPWFHILKTRWKMNTFGLQRYQMKPHIRSDVEGTGLVRFDKYPQYYQAARFEHGEWIGPYFDCDGYLNRWVITYAVPFFGLDALRKNVEFKGVVIVDLDLNKLDIDQCPQEFHIPNAFKNTAVCDFKSTRCEFMEKNGFKMGGYKCECKQGYEMPIQGMKWWFFDGFLMEKEFSCKQRELENRYDLFKCRVAGSAAVTSSVLLLLATSLFALLH